MRRCITSFRARTTGGCRRREGRAGEAVEVPGVEQSLVVVAASYVCKYFSKTGKRRIDWTASFSRHQTRLRRCTSLSNLQHPPSLSPSLPVLQIFLSIMSQYRRETQSTSTADKLPGCTGSSYYHRTPLTRNYTLIAQHSQSSLSLADILVMSSVFSR